MGVMVSDGFIGNVFEFIVLGMCGMNLLVLVLFVIN